MRQKREKANGIRVFLLCLLLGAGALALFVIQDRGAFLMLADFNKQEIPFCMELSGFLHALPKGKIGSVFCRQWDWGMDLGSSVLYSFGYYNLGSPFYWLTLPFPRSFYPYLMAPMMVLKYAAAGAFSYWYLKRFVRRKETAMIGAVLYAFSGWQTVNLLFFTFMDVVAFFPLLLLGLEKWMAEEERDPRLFVFAVFLNALNNYYFFQEEVLLVILYFLFRFSARGWKRLWKEAVVCLLYATIGLMMAGILFVPNLLYVLGNRRSTASLRLSDLFWEPYRLVYVLKGILLPAESTQNASAGVPWTFDSTSCYLPLFGFSLVLTYLLREKKRIFSRKEDAWLSRLICFLLVVSVIKGINAVFTLFTDKVYHRWWFMLVLMMALAGCKVLEEEKEKAICKGIFGNALCILLLSLSAYLFPGEGEATSALYRPVRFAFLCMIGVAAPMVWALLVKIARNRKRRDAGEEKAKEIPIRLTLVCACLGAVCTSILAIWQFRQGTDEQAMLSAYQVGGQLLEEDPQYRYALSDNAYVMSGDAKGLGSWSSTASNALTEFDGLFDFWLGDKRLVKVTVPGLQELLGGRYELYRGNLHEASRIGNGESEAGGAIETKSLSETEVLQSFTVSGESYQVIQKAACPIGYAVDSYITESDLRRFDKEDRGILLLHAVVIADHDRNLLSEKSAGLQRLSVAEAKKILSAKEEAVSEGTKRNQAAGVRDFEKDAGGFSCRTDYKKDQYVYFTVPQDGGWSASVDGKPVSILRSGGMMLIPVPAGNHQILCNYLTPGFTMGCILTIMGCLCAGWIFVRHGARGRKRQEE